LLQSSRSRVLLLAVLLCGISSAATIGNPVIERSTIDTCNGCSFALSTPFSTTGQLTTWSFWADVTGLSLTPLLYQNTGSSFVISGIGTAVSVSALGAQTYAFGLQAGSDLVDANTYFGYRDGTTESANTGTIPFTDSASGALQYYFGDGAGGPNADPFVGETMALGSFNGGLLNRNYSIQATSAASTVPEPSAWLLMAGGFGALLVRRRKR
jgi:hypothetical protein